MVEPLRIAEGNSHRGELADLSLELAQKSAGFRRSLPKSMVPPLATLVRSMNCYYSNLIEGHNSHPIDIERALINDYSADLKKRNLQLEAKAHISVQKWIDEGGLDGPATTPSAIREIHRRFYAEVPEDLRWVVHPDTQERFEIIPGEFRTRDIKVGQHIAVSPGAVPRFMARYDEMFSGMRKSEAVLSAAAAHHRLAWIHPFLDGNGRTVRLVSHATMQAVLETGALWSVARGLARSVEEYKRHLANCDQVRRNDLDGRGNLSEEALVEFTRYFLTVCIDQVTFMESLMQPDTLRKRMLRWIGEEMASGNLPTKSDRILEALLYRGELSRGDLVEILSVGDRQARRISASLFDCGVLKSDGPRDPIVLAFPATLAGKWLPDLFPDKVD